MPERVVRDAATEAQIRVANPGTAAWVSANAGSGKTKVLTDRVARLLLSGISPQRILCLTYTTAAASNMQIRLFDRLGGWSMMPDPELRGQLELLGQDPASLDHEHLRRARTLFARALEAPGGLRIQTIHSFGTAILRRFPLEAGVSPHFISLVDRAAQELRDSALDLVAKQSPGLMRSVSRYVNRDELAAVVGNIFSHRQRFAVPISDDEICQVFELDFPLPSPIELIRQLFSDPDCQLLATLLRALPIGGKSDFTAMERLSAIEPGNPLRSDLDLLQKVFLFGPTARSPFGPKTDSFPTRRVRDHLGQIFCPELNEYMRRVAEIRRLVLAVEAAEKTLTLHHFSRELLQAYEYRKRQVSALDFEDLILKTLELLKSPDTAEWVLFKLDDGVDHILVDEAQDVSRNQWEIVSRIAEEFTAGIGARDRERTVFAVGDEKQSIYGFQGAAPEKFSEMRDHFRDRYQETGKGFCEDTLQYSFRSSPAILQIVDRVFHRRSEPGFDGCAEHLAFKHELPGRVDLWPAISPAPRKDRPDWHSFGLARTEDGHRERLARSIAAQIRKMTDPDDPTFICSGGQVRPISFGDILILVRRRNDLFHLIINNLKSADLPVAGTDRLRLEEDLAIKDIRAILSFLASQSDDLSLAAVLRSPIFQLTEDQLYSIAHGRGESTLWHSLEKREIEFPETVAVLRDLLDQARKQRPYELIEYLLTIHGARERLVARIGPVVNEPIDAILQQAMDYDRQEASSLTGFLEWSSGEFEVKRQLDRAGDEIRVMTVHGAKGLESPIVILPDTDKRTVTPPPTELLMSEDGIPLWNVAKDNRVGELDHAADLYCEQQENEELRLLYVAMTRAESWLIIAGSGQTGPGSWYGLINTAMVFSNVEHLDPEIEVKGDEGQSIMRFSQGQWPERGDRRRSKTAVAIPLPESAMKPVDRPERPPEIRSPSRLGGEKSIPGDRRRGEDDGQSSIDHGNMVHLLLEHLPARSPEDRKYLAGNLLGAQFPDLTEDQFEQAYTEAADMLENPELAHVFGTSSMAEVGITASLPSLGGDRILGYIDRLVVDEDQVLAIDFKSNMVVPSREEDVPEGILRQLGAYREGLAGIYPGRKVDVAVLWTRTGQLMPVDPALCIDALGRAGADPEGRTTAAP